jgi:hypothetical protein
MNDEAWPSHDNPEGPEEQRDSREPMGISTGIAIGVGVGAAFGNIALGVALGSMLDKRRAQDEE